VRVVVAKSKTKLKMMWKFYTIKYSMLLL